MVLKLLRHFWLFNRMLEESRPSPLTWEQNANLQVLSRDFLETNSSTVTGPQVCIRCAVDMKIASEEETENFTVKNCVMPDFHLLLEGTACSCTYQYCGLYGACTSVCEPWGLYFLLLLIGLTLFAPAWFFIEVHIFGNMARLTPSMNVQRSLTTLNES